jgi:hypothetical protein
LVRGPPVQLPVEDPYYDSTVRTAKSTSKKPKGPEDRSVFERLHADAKRNDNYKSKDMRTSEQKTIEQHCSFTPNLVAASPFMSSRAIRHAKGRFGDHSSELDDDEADQMFSSQASSRSQSGTYKPAEKTRRKAHSSPKQGFSPFYYFRGDVEADGGFGMDDSNIDFPSPVSPPAPAEGVPSAEQQYAARLQQFQASQGGLYIPGFGLIRGPPATAGIPLFYYNPLYPPSFELGSYLSTTTVQSLPPAELTEESSADESSAGQNGPEAPALPQWAFTAGGDPDRAKASKGQAAPINIIKKLPEKEKPAEATGYYSIRRCVFRC